MQGTQRARRNIMGSFPSLKRQGQMVRFESLIQRDIIYFLEFDIDVVDYDILPFTITDIEPDGRAFTYTPHFQVIRSTGKTLVECVSARSMSEAATLRRIAQGERWAMANAHEFVVITDNDLRAGHRLANLKLLWRYSRFQVPLNHIAESRSLLQAHPEGLSFGVVAASLSGNIASLVHAPSLYTLLFRHILSVDLDQPLTPASIIRYSA